MNRNNPRWGKWDAEVYEEYRENRRREYQFKHVPKLDEAVEREANEHALYPVTTYYVDPETLKDDEEELRVELWKDKKDRYSKRSRRKG